MKSEESSRDLINSTLNQISSDLEGFRYEFLCEDGSLAFKYYKEDRSRDRYPVSESGIDVLESQKRGKPRKFTLPRVTN